MTYRPKRPVGEAVIILFDIVARKVADSVGQRSNSPALGDGATLLSGLARPAEPEAAAVLERCFQCDGKSSRRGRRRGGRRWHSVRDDDQSPVRLGGVDRGGLVSSR